MQHPTLLKKVKRSLPSSPVTLLVRPKENDNIANVRLCRDLFPRISNKQVYMQ